MSAASHQTLQARIIATVARLRKERLLVGTAGNISAREPGAAEFWITPSGVDYETLSAEQLVPIDITASPSPHLPPPCGEGRGGGRTLKPSSDTAIHDAIYRQRSDVAGIVHTHSTYATVFTVLRREIPALLVEAAGYLGGTVPVMAYLPPASPELGERAAQGLGSRRAVLLPNHGVITVGESVESAFTAALLVEQSARVAYLASLLGEPAVIPAGEIERMHRFLHEEYGQRP